MRWKLTLGMILLSTSSMILLTSPDLMDVSALIVSSTSVEMRLHQRIRRLIGGTGGRDEGDSRTEQQGTGQHQAADDARRCKVAVVFMKSPSFKFDNLQAHRKDGC